MQKLISKRDSLISLRLVYLGEIYTHEHKLKRPFYDEIF